MSDARMSGTAYGTIILHVSPDAASGGPIGLLQTGDRVRLSVQDRRIEILLSEAELESRRGAATPARASAPRGYARLYAEQVLQAEEGCDFQFLTERIKVKIDQKRARMILRCSNSRVGGFELQSSSL